MSAEDRVYLCTACHWEKVPFKRWQIGIAKKDPSYFTCLPCGEEQAKAERASWCVVPLHKSNYMKINLKSDLKGINNKGGLVK